MNLEIDGSGVTLRQLREAWQAPLSISLTDDVRQRVSDAQRQVEEVLKSGESVYGVNTGFGQLAKVRISDDELTTLQENLIRSHAVGVGQPLDDSVVRLVMATKIIGLARGHSGVQLQPIDALCALLQKELYPVIPSQGSVGASGDLAPLAHMAGVLIGEGYVRYNEDTISAADALRAAGLSPLKLAPKEGLALLNGTQVSAALALAALFRAEHVLSASIAAGALSSDAIQGSDTPFDSRIHAARGHSGQAAVAEQLRNLMHGSEIRASHVDCNRVQDPYSVRCQPQVTGACLGVIQHVAEVLVTEANAATDNPLVFADTGDVLSGGNFHAEVVAMVADYLALAIAELGALSERRVALLIDTHLSELPAFLVEDSGLNSGFMMAQVTAAALASENKTLAHPASVDSLPTSANQEDHVSMATFAARRLHDMLDNVSHIVAIELLAAAQGIEFQRPKKTSEPLQRVHAIVRDISPKFDRDRSLSNDIAMLAVHVSAGRFCEFSNTLLPSGAR